MNKKQRKESSGGGSGGGDKVPTLKMLAAKVGCSAALVSMALRGNPRVGAATREKIQAVAKASGWRPNPLVQAHQAAMRRGRPDHAAATLAIVVDYELNYPEKRWEGLLKAEAERRGFNPSSAVGVVG